MYSNILGFFQVFRHLGLPDEIICKILYEFQGVQHPIVDLLLKKTDVESVFSKMPYIDDLLKKYKKFGNTLKLTNYFIKKQKDHSNKYNTDDLIYRDIGYILPRPFGRLYHELNETKLVEPGMKMDYWELNRSRKILECGSLRQRWLYKYGYSVYNDSPIQIATPTVSEYGNSDKYFGLLSMLRIEYKSWTSVLQYYEIFYSNDWEVDLISQQNI
jgi:hypothetical protein